MKSFINLLLVAAVSSVSEHIDKGVNAEQVKSIGLLLHQVYWSEGDS